MNAIIVPARIGAFVDFRQSLAAGDLARAFDERMVAVHRSAKLPFTVGGSLPAGTIIIPSSLTKDPKPDLFDALVHLKVETSRVAMHLPDDWRRRLFKQLDSLLDHEEWDSRDNLPHQHSFRTLLRVYIHIRPEIGPGLGLASNGNFIAAWTRGLDNLTFECLPNDQIRWSLSRSINDEKERAAGQANILRIADVLNPYSPSHWFEHAVSPNS